MLRTTKITIWGLKHDFGKTMPLQSNLFLSLVCFVVEPEKLEIVRSVVRSNERAMERTTTTVFIVSSDIWSIFAVASILMAENIAARRSYTILCLDGQCMGASVS